MMLKMVGMSPTDMAPTTEATCPIEILQGVVSAWLPERGRTPTVVAESANRNAKPGLRVLQL